MEISLEAADCDAVERRYELVRGSERFVAVERAGPSLLVLRTEEFVQLTAFLASYELHEIFKLKIYVDVLCALRECHRQGIVHCGLTMDAVYVTSLRQDETVVKLTGLERSIVPAELRQAGALP